MSNHTPEGIQDPSVQRIQFEKAELVEALPYGEHGPSSTATYLELKAQSYIQWYQGGRLSLNDLEDSMRTVFGGEYNRSTSLAVSRTPEGLLIPVVVDAKTLAPVPNGAKSVGISCVTRFGLTVGEDLGGLDQHLSSLTSQGVNVTDWKDMVQMVRAQPTLKNALTFDVVFMGPDLKAKPIELPHGWRLVNLEDGEAGTLPKRKFSIECHNAATTIGDLLRRDSSVYYGDPAGIKEITADVKYTVEEGGRSLELQEFKYVYAVDGREVMIRFRENELGKRGIQTTIVSGGVTIEFGVDGKLEQVGSFRGDQLTHPNARHLLQTVLGRDFLATTDRLLPAGSIASLIKLISTSPQYTSHDNYPRSAEEIGPSNIDNPVTALAFNTSRPLLKGWDKQTVYPRPKS